MSTRHESDQHAVFAQPSACQEVPPDGESPFPPCSMPISRRDFSTRPVINLLSTESEEFLPWIDNGSVGIASFANALKLLAGGVGLCGKMGGGS